MELELAQHFHIHHNLVVEFVGLELSVVVGSSYRTVVAMAAMAMEQELAWNFHIHHSLVVEFVALVCMMGKWLAKRFRMACSMSLGLCNLHRRYSFVLWLVGFVVGSSCMMVAMAVMAKELELVACCHIHHSYSVVVVVVVAVDHNQTVVVVVVDHSLLGS